MNNLGIFYIILISVIGGIIGLFIGKLVLFSSMGNIIFLIILSILGIVFLIAIVYCVNIFLNDLYNYIIKK